MVHLVALTEFEARLILSSEPICRNTISCGQASSCGDASNTHGFKLSTFHARGPYVHRYMQSMKSLILQQRGSAPLILLPLRKFADPLGVFLEGRFEKGAGKNCTTCEAVAFIPRFISVDLLKQPSQTTILEAAATKEILTQFNCLQGLGQRPPRFCVFPSLPAPKPQHECLLVIASSGRACEPRKIYWLNTHLGATRGLGDELPRSLLRQRKTSALRKQLRAHSMQNIALT